MKRRVTNTYSQYYTAEARFINVCVDGGAFRIAQIELMPAKPGFFCCFLPSEAGQQTEEEERERERKKKKREKKETAPITVPRQGPTPGAAREKAKKVRQGKCDRRSEG